VGQSKDVASLERVAEAKTNFTMGHIFLIVSKIS